MRELTRRVLPADPWWEGCEAIPAGYRIPEGYEVERSGIWFLREGKEGAERIPVSTGPVVVVAVYVDPDGDQLVELVWLDGEKWVTRTVPRSVTKSGRKLVPSLGDAGFPATESDARAVERWLARSEQANRSRIPRHALARWLGWQPDGTFATGQDAPHRVEPAHPEQRPALAAHHPAGTLDGLAGRRRPAGRLPGRGHRAVGGVRRAAARRPRPGLVHRRRVRPLHARQDHRGPRRPVGVGRRSANGPTGCSPGAPPCSPRRSASTWCAACRWCSTRPGW